MDSNDQRLTSSQRESGGSLRSPIARRSLHDDIVERIREMIYAGDLAPGERIHEGRLCEEFNISRTPLREALKYVASEGLLDLVPNRGAVVRKFTPEYVCDSLRVIGALEALAAGIACEIATEDELAHMDVLQTAMEEAYRSNDRLSYFKLNQEIHSALVAMSRNEPLVTTHNNLQSQFKRIRFIGSDSPDKWAAALEEHRKMHEVLRARDGSRLAAMLSEHFVAAWERVKHAL